MPHWIFQNVVHTVPEIYFNRTKMWWRETLFFQLYRVSGCAWICFQNPQCVAFFFQGHSRSWDVMHTLYCTQTPIHLAFFYLRQTLTTQIVQNILLNMSRLHMMMHDLRSKGHLTVKVIEGQTVFMDIWIFVNITTKRSDICINTIY